MSDNGRLMTLAQAAERSACSVKTVRRAIDNGQLTAYRLGQGAKSDRIHPAELDAWWAKSRLAIPHFSFPNPPRRPIPQDSADESLADMLGIPRPGAKPSFKKAAEAKSRGKGASAAAPST